MKIGYSKGELVAPPIKMLNRHGLICGATGSGKTKTVQLLAEQLSLNGVPSFHLDLKGDLSGLAGLGETNEFISNRYKSFGIEYKPKMFPTNFFTISNNLGNNLKFNLFDFGASFLGNILDLNGTQKGMLTVLFKFADDNLIKLETLKDLQELIIWSITEQGQIKIAQNYGRLSGASMSTILRKVIEFEMQGGGSLFEFNSFSNDTFLRRKNGLGLINILRVNDIQERTRQYATFLQRFLAGLYSSLPEVGDLDKPKFVLFIDEAHLIFDCADAHLIKRIEQIVRLIRSKGVGLIFCTQLPTDIPENILGQLGLKIQHVLRAFTAKDRQAIKKAAENYPIPDGLKSSDIEFMMTNLSIGEALITYLTNEGKPTPVQKLTLLAPQSSMNIIDDSEIERIASANYSAIQRYEQRETDKISLVDWVKANLNELEFLAATDRRFDFYQTIKVVNNIPQTTTTERDQPTETETIEPTDTPPTVKKAYQIYASEINNWNFIYPINDQTTELELFSEWRMIDICRMLSDKAYREVRVIKLLTERYKKIAPELFLGEPVNMLSSKIIVPFYAKKIWGDLDISFPNR